MSCLQILNVACEEGILDDDALAMMEGAIEVSETQVRDAMIPRSQMVVVNNDSRLEEFLPRIIESGHSRFPVIGEDKDEVVGILMAKDLSATRCVRRRAVRSCSDHPAGSGDSGKQTAECSVA